MTTIVGGQFVHTAPLPLRCGILLNASPSSSAPNSPKRASYLSPCFSSTGAAGKHQTPVSSHSSASSSTSSTDDIVSSTSATSASGTQASSSSATAHQPLRKIRFAPLPEPRRDFEYDDDLPGFYNDLDSAGSSPYHATQAVLSPPVSPNIRPATLTRSPNLSASHAQASCSTLGLSLDGADLLDSGQATETNTVTGSEYGTDDTHTLANSKKKATPWSRLLHLPKTSSKTGPRTPEEHGQSTLWRSPSRESTASGYSLRGGFGNIFGSMSDSNASSTSLGNPLSRRKTHSGTTSVPVSPSLSFRGGLSLKPVVSEAGTSATPAPRGKGHAQTGSAPPTVRRGVRLLNGRVYGSRRPNSAGGLAKNPFANIRNVEPEFVEWGNGGMGSVQAAGVGSSQWARLQSSKKLSVGHDDGTVAGDEDDGSGMSWVKKRREARERERREREEREAKEKAERENGGADGEPAQSSESAVADGPAAKGELKRSLSRTSKSELEPSAKEVPGPVSPSDAREGKELRDTLAPGERRTINEAIEAKEEKDRKEREHFYTAVTVPAPWPHLLHTHSRQNSLNSGLQTPVRSAIHTPTTEMPSHTLVTGTPTVTPSTAALGPSTLGLAGVSADESRPPSSSSSSSYEDESPVGEKDEENDEEEEEEEANEQARKTAIGAGVEKISRHKD